MQKEYYNGEYLHLPGGVKLMLGRAMDTKHLSSFCDFESRHPLVHNRKPAYSGQKVNQSSYSGPRVHQNGLLGPQVRVGDQTHGSLWQSNKMMRQPEYSTSNVVKQVVPPVSSNVVKQVVPPVSKVQKMKYDKKNHLETDEDLRCDEYLRYKKAEWRFNAEE